MKHIWYSNVDFSKSRIFEISTLNFVSLYLQEYLELSERMVLSFWTFSELFIFSDVQRSHSATKCFMSTNFNLYNSRNIQRKSKFTTENQNTKVVSNHSPSHWKHLLKLSRTYNCQNEISKLRLHNSHILDSLESTLEYPFRTGVVDSKRPMAGPQIGSI